DNDKFISRHNEKLRNICGKLEKLLLTDVNNEYSLCEKIIDNGFARAKQIINDQTTNDFSQLINLHDGINNIPNLIEAFLKIVIDDENIITHVKNALTNHNIIFNKTNILTKYIEKYPVSIKKIHDKQKNKSRLCAIEESNQQLIKN